MTKDPKKLLESALVYLEEGDYESYTTMMETIEQTLPEESMESYCKEDEYLVFSI